MAASHRSVFAIPELDTNCRAARQGKRLQIVRYTTDERLDEIMAKSRERGVQINNPPVYVVEVGKQNSVEPKVLEFKQRFDPLGLLSPGKLRVCEQLKK